MRHRRFLLAAAAWLFALTSVPSSAQTPPPVPPGPLSLEQVLRGDPSHIAKLCGQ